MIHRTCAAVQAVTAPVLLVVGAALTMPAAHADNDNNTLVPNNKRLNDGVLANVYTAQRQAGCQHDVNPNPQLQLAAQRHTDDLMNNRNLDGNVGSDGSSPQDRADAAGYRGPVAETVAINPALSINGVEILNQWFNDPASRATMSDCANTQVGVWSENSLSRTVVVAVYGHPQQPDPPRHPTQPGQSGQPAQPLDVLAEAPAAMDPTPDYDASDELQFGLSWLPWILRGAYPPPGYPPQ
ncbi:hypothetical protein A5692_15930 [Mycobacterium sp. E342]|nr:hypothetical protein A9X04_11235 [Mycobacterium sp. E3247]OBH32090.1 hypothetical protein A5692_15930 [Mycobacterium sp. E342]